MSTPSMDNHREDPGPDEDICKGKEFDQYYDALIPNFLEWLNQLNRWSVAAQATSPEEATKTLFGGHNDGWIEDGWAWMDSIPSNTHATTQLAQWIAQGKIDPVQVLQQLRAQKKFGINGNTSMHEEHWCMECFAPVP